MPLPVGNYSFKNAELNSRNLAEKQTQLYMNDLAEVASKCYITIKAANYRNKSYNCFARMR